MNKYHLSLGKPPGINWMVLDQAQILVKNQNDNSLADNIIKVYRTTLENFTKPVYGNSGIHAFELRGTGATIKTSSFQGVRLHRLHLLGDTLSSHASSRLRGEKLPASKPPIARPALEENIVLGVALECSKRTLPIKEQVTLLTTDAKEVTSTSRNGNGSTAEDKKDGKIRPKFSNSDGQ
ncbi:hypothetical protein V6N13_111351 [Hibiscus sabdariffa]|uniref:Uncharacterized protein n=1 Tax=Hibiscus sabdariffa TaxID=183260 RepID=A0ABR2TKP8_9ROSI